MTGATRRLRALVVASAVAALLTSCTGGGGGDKDEQPDALPAPLPAVQLESFDGGEPLDLAEVRGPAVVNLWASWCGPCRREMPILEQFSQKYAGRVEMIGIDFQDAQSDEARELADDTGVTYPLYADLDGELDRAAPFPHVAALPFLAFVDAEGQVVEQLFVEIKSLGQLEELVAEHLDVGAP